MEAVVPHQPIFSIAPDSSGSRIGRWGARCLRPIESVLGLSRCAALYGRVSRIQQPDGFMRALLTEMGVRC